MDLVQEFKRLPSTLGIKAKDSHFKYLDRIIDEEIGKFPDDTQRLFYLLISSFKTEYIFSGRKDFENIKKLFRDDPNYSKLLGQLIKNIKKKFFSIN